MLAEARSNHRAALEESVGTMNTKGLWDHMKRVTNMNTNRIPLATLDEPARADELNDFFLRHNLNSPEATVDFNIDFIVCNSSDRFLIDPLQVQNAFSKVSNKKSMGPDGLPALLLKKCSEELTDAWCPIFQRSVDNHTVPNIWKKSLNAK